MLKWTITYVDYDGDSHTEDFFFNLNKAEVIELNFSHQGGYKSYIDKVIAAKDTGEVIKAVKDIIKLAYGVKSPDGKRFIKSDAETEAFVQSEAYSELFMQLATDEQACIKFVTGILPKELREQAAQNGLELASPAN